MPGKRTNRKPVVVEEVEGVHSVYSNRAKARDAVRTLKNAGFGESDISVTRVPAGDQSGGLGGTVARVAGGVLGIGSVSILLLPAMFALRTVSMLGMGITTLMKIPYSVEPVRNFVSPADELLVVKVHTDTVDAVREAKQVLQSTGGKAIGLSGEYHFTRQNHAA